MNSPSRLEELLNAARGLESALELALQAEDRCVGLVAAARLRVILRRSAASLEATSVGDPAHRATLLSVFEDSTRRMYKLLQRAPTDLDGCDPQRLTRWALARSRGSELLGGPHVFELDTAGLDMRGARLRGIHVLRCRFITSLRGARFLDALVEDSDFTYSDLADTQWQGTRVDRSFLRDSCLVNASLDRVTFLECDLRGADLSVMSDTAQAADVGFVRCDLRGTGWAGRDLSHVAVTDCLLHGATDVVAANPLRVIRGDLSPDGDGSRMIGERGIALFAASQCVAVDGEDLLQAVERGDVTAADRSTHMAQFEQAKDLLVVTSTVQGNDAAVVKADDELFLILVVNPDFGPQVYETAFRLLQTPHRSKLFDLTRAVALHRDVFAHLASAWTASPGSIPRLGVVLPFERWAMFRDLAVAQLQPLVARGVEIAILYDQQVNGANLFSWFAHGRIVHDVPGVVQSLLLQWQPDANWSVVIEAAVDLVHAHACMADIPALLTDIAEIALFCGSAERAEPLAREALQHLGEAPCATRAKALRELGTALIARGECQTGLSMLDRSIRAANLAQDPSLGATALCRSGLHVLHRGDHADAESRFRQAIELLSPLAALMGHRSLLATVHRNLAIALLQQGSEDAEHHAARALELRPDQECSLADEDRMLRTRLRELRTTIAN